MKKHHIKHILISISYILLSAYFLSIIGPYTSNFRTILQIEYCIYDQLQSRLSINSFQQWFEMEEGHLKKEMEDIFLIKLDSTFIDPQSNRLHRDKLAHLLDTMHRYYDPYAIYIEFEFLPLDEDTQKDNLLKKSFTQWKEKVILPYSLPSKNLVGIKKKDQFTIPQFVDSSTTRGYLAFSDSDHDKMIRFIQVGSDQDENLSVFFSLLRSLRQQGQKRVPNTDDIPSKFEINYLLNKKPIDATYAIPSRNASSIVKNPDKRSLSQKVVFIGLFDNYQDQYHRALLEFKTPVSHDMNAAYISLNAYLNIMTNSYIRPASKIWLFSLYLSLLLLNLIYIRVIKVRLKINYQWMEVTLSILLWVLMIWFHFKWYYIKLPVVIISISWIIHPKLYTYLLKQILK